VSPLSDVTAVRCGRLVDVTAGEILDGMLVLVRGERIEEVRPEAAGAIPRDARLVDLSDHTVAPGLIDCHSHLVGNIEFAGVASTMDSEATEAFAAVRNARATLLAGFTAVRDVGTFRAFVDVALRDAIEDGSVPGPRMSVAGPYVTSSSGGGDVVGLAHDIVLPRSLRFGVADSADEVRRVVREILHGGADFIKVIATGAVLTRGTSPGAPEFTEGEIRAAVDEAARYDTYVAAHAHGAEGIKMAVRAGVRSIEHGSLMDDEAIELMRDRGTYLVADIYNGDFIAEQGRREHWPAETLKKNDDTTDAQRAGFRRALAAGVKIAFGTDVGIFPHGTNARQLPYMVRHGMTPVQSIRSATLVAAELLGWEDRVGSIAPGLLADLVAVPGHDVGDLSVFTCVDFVMKGGRVVRADELPGPRA
jgi:imidazolonepropionase-like amidohydrolase